MSEMSCITIFLCKMWALDGNTINNGMRLAVGCVMPVRVLVLKKMVYNQITYARSDPYLCMCVCVCIVTKL